MVEVLGQIVERLMQVATDWVRDQQRRLSPGSRPLSRTETAALAAWFEAETLGAARVVLVERCPRPEFLTPQLTAQLTALGADPALLQIDRMAGITFGDLMVIATFGVSAFRLRPKLLFHELVHVAQYRELGVAGFMEVYLRGFTTAGYRGTPPEVQAYALTDRFQRGESFSVEADVRDVLGRRA